MMNTREFVVEVEGRRVPVVLWTPGGPKERRPLLLIGHGGSQHKTHPGIVDLAARFVENGRFAVAAIDGPIHGARRASNLSGPAMQAEFLAMWRADNHIDTMVADWKAAIDSLVMLEDVRQHAIGWYGVSMGTAHGLPLAAAEPRIRLGNL